MYWQAITVLEAQELLNLGRVSQLPHMKESSAKKYIESMERLAFPKGKAKTTGPELSSEEFAKRIGEQLGKRQ